MKKGKQNSISTFDKNFQSLKTSPKPFQNRKYPPSKERSSFSQAQKVYLLKKLSPLQTILLLFFRTM